MCVGEQEREKYRTKIIHRDRLKRLNFKEGNLQKQNRKKAEKNHNITINNNKYELGKSNKLIAFIWTRIEYTQNQKYRRGKISMHIYAEWRVERIKNFSQWKWKTKSTYTCTYKNETKRKGKKNQQVCVMQTSTRTIEQSHQTYQHQQQLKQKETIIQYEISFPFYSFAFAIQNAFLCMHLDAHKMRGQTSKKYQLLHSLL